MARLEIKESDPVLLTVARLSADEQYKGYDRVIEALSDLRHDFPRIKYIIGGSGEDRTRIEKLISSLKLESHVVLPGLIPQELLPDYYRLCDLFIMPSRGEGFGIVYLEALSSGKPVIASSFGGAVDALKNGDLGILVDPDSPAAISAAVRSILLKTCPPQLSDPNYLRNSAIASYGYEKFASSLSGIMERLSSEFA
jgi:glycosyltransferase involved in cell wall biosynthesis